MAKRAWKWKHNIWTGDATHDVDENTRIFRIGRSGPYFCQYWGDYSPRYPVQGPYKHTAEAALKTCSAVRRRKK